MCFIGKSCGASPVTSSVSLLYDVRNTILDRIQWKICLWYLIFLKFLSPLELRARKQRARGLGAQELRASGLRASEVWHFTQNGRRPHFIQSTPVRSCQKHVGIISEILDSLFPEIRNSPWTDCSAACGQGFKTRNQTCFLGKVKATADECNGFQGGMINMTCQIKPCPSPGGYKQQAIPVHTFHSLRAWQSVGLVILLTSLGSSCDRLSIQYFDRVGRAKMAKYHNDPGLIYYYLNLTCHMVWLWKVVNVPIFL